MINEDAITVSITASKEMEGMLDPMPFKSEGNAYHSGVNDVMGNSEGRRSSGSGKYTVYTVFVRNPHTGGKCVVKRRYSDFYKLRKQLIEFVSWGHCKHCNHYFMEISGYPFPRRRLLRSSTPHVVKERMDSLGLFLRDLLLCIMAKSYAGCSQAQANIETCILKSFLQLEQEELLFPKQSSNAMNDENKQALVQQKKTGEARSKSLGYTKIDKQRMYEDIKRAQSDRTCTVAADTCRQCLQKWTHCYCNEEEDHIYPVAGLAHLRLDDQDPVPMERSNSCSSNADSDASRCSRCERDWDNCFCCQQVSPTASSAYTEH